MLRGINISKTIDKKKILTEIDLAITPGKIAVLIGPSGGGKSTLLRNLSLLEKPDSGCIELDDRKFDFPMDFKHLPNYIHPKVSVVFQQFHLWPHLKVKENLLMPLDVQGITFTQTEFNELLNYFEIDHLLNQFPYQLSVGQKQRIAFVRAILLKPKYLLLDEVTSALDIQHISKMLHYLKKLSDTGTGILVATHLIGFASSIADHILFLNAGKIVEEGDKTILKSPKTELLYNFLRFSEYAG